MKRLLATPIIAIALFIFLGAGVAIGSIFIGGAGAVELQKGLVGHWKFDDAGDGTARDSTSNRNNGTVTGATATTDRKAQSNKAYISDGNGFINTNKNFTTTTYSISLWAKIPSGTNTGFQNIVTQGPLNNNRSMQITFRGTDQIDPGKVQFNQANGTSVTFVRSLATLNDDAWHHHVATYSSGNVLTYYVDGTSQGTDTLTGTPSNDASNFVIGQFNGSIDDVRIYNRALSTAEITALYDQYDPGVRVADTQKGLVGHWRLDGNAKDSTPNQNNGTVTGATLTTDRKGQAGKAYSFNGTTNLIDFGSSSLFDFGTGSFTASIWFKHGNEGGINQHFFDYTDNVYNSPRWYFRFASATTFEMVITDGVVAASYSVANTLADDNWHLATMAKDADANEVRHYIDGALVDPDDITGQGSMTQTDANVVIGSGNSAGSVFYAGELDDIRIYNRALSAAEIQVLYDSYNPVLQVSDLQKGLVGNWKMDGNAKDSSSSRNHGTVTGATLTTDRKGQSNKAYDFVLANSDNINIGNVLNAGTADFSISAWVNSANPAGNQYIVSKGNVDGTCTADGNQGYLLYLYQSVFRVKIDTGSAQGCFTLAGDTTIQTGWNHVVAVADRDGSGSIYVNGVLDKAATLSSHSNSLDNAQPLRIGRYSSVSFAPFGGQIDDVRIYNRVLSPTEITTLYESYQ